MSIYFINNIWYSVIYSVWNAISYTLFGIFMHIRRPKALLADIVTDFAIIFLSKCSLIIKPRYLKLSTTHILFPEHVKLYSVFIILGILKCTTFVWSISIFNLHLHHLDRVSSICCNYMCMLILPHHKCWLVPFITSACCIPSHKYGLVPYITGACYHPHKYWLVSFIRCTCYPPFINSDWSLTLQVHVVHRSGLQAWPCWYLVPLTSQLRKHSHSSSSEIRLSAASN